MGEIKEEKNMKKLLGIAALATLVLTGCSKDLQVQPVDKLTVEYGDKLDNSKLFNAKESDENVKSCLLMAIRLLKRKLKLL